MNSYHKTPDGEKIAVMQHDDGPVVILLSEKLYITLREMADDAVWFAGEYLSEEKRDRYQALFDGMPET